MGNNMDALLIAKERTVLSENAFHEIVVWHVPSPVPGSSHGFKYRLALVVRGECILRYDNERGISATGKNRSSSPRWRRF